MKTILPFLVFFVGAFAAPNDISDRLIGGEEARRGEFPYMVSVQLCIENSLKEVTCHHVCGGAILDPEWVITAAHCVTDGPEGIYQVVAGSHILVGENPDQQVRGVSSQHIHPDYPGEGNPHVYDIVLLKLDELLQFNRAVHEVELPIHEFEYENDVLMTGWGALGPDGSDDSIMPNTLHFVRTHVITNDECKNALDTILGGQPHPLNAYGNVCTGPLTGGKAICKGDSGNPLVDYSERRLIGIASWTVNPCGIIGAPSVHTRISPFTRWIINIIKYFSDDPTEPSTEAELQSGQELEPQPGPDLERQLEYEIASEDL